ncbi:MAG: response regulator transcription factor [Chitinophagaceae bacterium]
MATKIILFEDNDSLRSSLVMLLNSSDTYAVIGDYHDCKKADYYVLRDEPDVVIMDIDLPGKTGIEGVRMIKEANPEIYVIMYTMFEDDEKLFQSLCAGANGYILKKTSPDKLVEAIGEVINGGAPMSPVVAKKVLQSFQDNTAYTDYHLTKREKEILQWLVKGYLVKHISAELDMAFNTARSHLKNIYRKLHVNCGKEAIAKVLKEHII